MTDDKALAEAAALLAEFLTDEPFTKRLARIEEEAKNADADQLKRLAVDAGIETSLLVAGAVVRKAFGRVSDVIHATGTLLCLPHLLAAGETISNRPSLAAGNDRSRPFDVETDEQVAEFKFSVWRGSADVARQRSLVRGYVRLAADDSGRARRLYVIGPQPVRFLTTSRSKMTTWLTSRNDRDQFENVFGPIDGHEVATFVAAHPEVDVVDLVARLPHVVGSLPHVVG